MCGTERGEFKYLVELVTGRVVVYVCVGVIERVSDCVCAVVGLFDVYDIYIARQTCLSRISE